MAKFIIQGPNILSGTVRVSGNKNSTFPLIAAALLVEETTKLTNVPNIKDVDVLVEILEDLGVRVDWNKETSIMIINPANFAKYEINSELGEKLRGAIVLASSLLVKFGKAQFPRPGGDPIGARPLDAHLSAMQAFGVNCDRDFLGVKLYADKLKPADIFLEEASPTATEMAMITASGIEGETVIEGAACEPHVVDLAGMLVKMGVEIQGEGTNTIRVRGTKQLKAVEHKVRPDHIEVGTFAIASAITGGTINIEDAYPQDLKIILAYLSHMGVKYFWKKDTVLTIKPSLLKAGQRTFKTRTWPGFPTDMMSQFIVLATQSEGTVLCHDWMYESRMYFIDRLIKMGANIFLADPHRVIVIGPSKLHGDLIPSADIRAGGALVLAALAAAGESIVEHAEVIDRGYESFDQKLSSLGANIRRED